MQETELKFQVPPAQRAALRKAVGTAGATLVRLQAVYADTADQHLAAAGLALRLRKEGRVWVQTLKGRGDGLLQRMEHEVALPPQRGMPLLDPARHDGTLAGAALRAALGAAGDHAALLPVYRTDIQRLFRRLRHAGAVVEVAYDVGHILATALDAERQAGPATDPKVHQRKLAVNEIEFELKSGPAQALTELAARWATRHGLWWDVRTKSERGFRLALGLQQVPVTRAADVKLPAAASPLQARAAVLQSTLAQVLPNLAELAGAAEVAEVAEFPESTDSTKSTGSAASTDSPAAGMKRKAVPAATAHAASAHAAEHLHQLRVGLRRLRTALVLLADWGDEQDALRCHALDTQWREVFLRLGGARDTDVLESDWLPRLLAAGAPAGLPGAAAAAVDVGAILRDRQVSVLLLQTLALSLPGPEARSESALEPTHPAQEDPDLEPGPGPEPKSKSKSKSKSKRKGKPPAPATAELLQATRKVLRQAWHSAMADARRFPSATLARQHRARKRLKRFRYALEFLHSVLPQPLDKVVEKRLQSALTAMGAHNDLHTAQAHFRELADSTGDAQAWFALGWLAARAPRAQRRAVRALAALEGHRKPWR